MKVIFTNTMGLRIPYDTEDINYMRTDKAANLLDKDELKDKGYKANEPLIVVNLKDGTKNYLDSEWVIVF